MLTVIIFPVPADAMPSDAEEFVIVAVLSSSHKNAPQTVRMQRLPMIKLRRNEMLDGQLCRTWSFSEEFLVEIADRSDIH
jgi:hypothetical protein